MEVQECVTVLCLVLLLSGSSVPQRKCNGGEVLSKGECIIVEKIDNGFKNFLPKEPEGEYNIHLKAFQFKTAGDAECMLGEANNYMPWIFSNGSLTVKNRTIALDLSNLKLVDDAMSALVRSLDALSSLNEVIYLSMAKNRMTLLPLESLVKFQHVEYLSLMRNPFREFSPDLEVRPKMPHLGSLIVLDMRYSRLQVLPPNFFHDLPKLEYLFLSHNYITNLPASLFYSLGRLVHLDLSHMDSNSLREEEARMDNPFMRLIAGMDMDAHIFEPLKKLRFLDLSFSKLDFKAFMAMTSLGTQLEYVSYCYTDLPTLMDYLFVMKSIKMLDLSGNVGCARALDANSFQLLRDSLEVIFFKDASITQLDWLTGMHNLRVINLRGNFVSSLDGAPFPDLTSLESFDASRNFIQSWSHQIFQLNDNMKLLNLRNNNLLMITSAMLRDFEILKFVAIGGNQLQCTCYFIFLMHVAIGNSSTQIQNGNNSSVTTTMQPNYSVEHVNLYDYSEEDYLCMNFTSKKKLNPIDLPVCGRENEDNYSNVSEGSIPESVEEIIEEYVVIYIVTSVLVTLALVIAFLIYRNWFYIKYFLVLLKNSAILSFFDDDKVYLDKTCLEENISYQYDVFVSYSDNDRAWVLDEMLPNLEQEDLITVCLHERDFEVGYGILENIISCMDRSRCLMLIVSESFLLSRWCQFEMHLAQHRLLETRRDELILVLLEDIPRRKCPKTLSYLMKTKTYIQWPRQQTRDRELFWKRLRKALMTTRC